MITVRQAQEIIDAAPSASNPYWRSVDYGGYCHCIPMDGNGYVLPNCVGVPHGIFDQLKNLAEGTTGVDSGLCRGNAKNYWGYPDGLPRGQTPKIGAIGCWSGGDGHVGVVCAIKGDTVRFKMSEYKGKEIYYRELTAPFHYTGSQGRMTFLGFIYPDKWVATYTQPQPVDADETKDQIEVLCSDLRLRTSPGIKDDNTTGLFCLPGYFDILESADADGYTWRRISDDMWVADMGGSDTAYHPHAKTEIERLTEKNEALAKKNEELEQQLAEAQKAASEAENKAQALDDMLKTADSVIDTVQKEIEAYKASRGY